MNGLKGIALIFLLQTGFVSVQAQDDSVQYQPDMLLQEDDPTTHFFNAGEKLPNASKVLLVTKAKRTITLTAFLKSADMSYADHTLADLDNDGKKELVISNFTGGAHCCDEIYIFRPVAPGKFQYVVKLFGGHTVITKKREFEFSFDESFGYFFTCYACDYADTGDAAPIPLRRITLRYNRGKLAVVPGDKKLLGLINDNLGKLGNLPFGKLEDELAMDEGLRKEVAMNLAVYYFSFGRNLQATQHLFNKYYRYPDAKQVWTAFTKSLLYLKTDNDF